MISNVIHAYVKGGRYTVTEPILKEDYGCYLKIENMDLPDTKLYIAKKNAEAISALS